jgi:cytochrome c biogenesis protein CcmG/thiol:disulfide interchange protein DsbE
VALAVLATAVILVIANVARPPAPGATTGIARDKPAPAFSGVTLDGATLALTDLRGRPVILNFWGPSCVPCRDEFPLFSAKLASHAADGLAIVGILMYDAPAPARDFVAAYGATWPSVQDADGAIRTAYRVAARPQTYFIDRDGTLRGIQVGQLTDADFERLYAEIAGPAAGSGSPNP